MSNSKGYAAAAADKPLGPFAFDRREPGPTDVQIEIAYCGVCHSDLHTARNEWKNTIYPCVPGHEIVGKVSKVGAKVKNFKPGDLAGGGCHVGSCGTCSECNDGLENYCNSMVLTYNSPDPGMPGQVTYGGYSNRIVISLCNGWPRTRI